MNIADRSSLPKAYKVHTIEEARLLPVKPPEQRVGRKWVYYDKSMGKTRMYIQLDEKGHWELECYFSDDTWELEEYCLSYGERWESFYHFTDEDSVRKELCSAIGVAESDTRYLDELMIEFKTKSRSEWALEEIVKKYITAQFHYD